MTGLQSAPFKLSSEPQHADVEGMHQGPICPLTLRRLSSEQQLRGPQARQPRPHGCVCTAQDRVISTSVHRHFCLNFGFDFFSHCSFCRPLFSQ